MCRKSNGACSALGPEPWDSRCPLPPLDWFDASIDAFAEAVAIAVENDLVAANVALQATRSEELQEWMHVHAQNSGVWRARGVTPFATQRHVRTISAALERSLFARDNYTCRYCGIRVFPASVLKCANALLGPEVFPIRGGNLARHGIKMCFSATLDHVTPLHLGGTNDATNLVTACWCCNYGKADYTLQQLGLLDPREFEVVPSSWLGMTELLSNARATS